MNHDLHFTKRSPMQNDFSNLLSHKAAAQNHLFLKTLLFPPQLKAPQSVYIIEVSISVMIIFSPLKFDLHLFSPTRNTKYKNNKF